MSRYDIAKCVVFLRSGSRMKLTETESGQAWLENFPAADKNRASRLLEAFVLVGWTEARLRLLELLQQVISEHEATGPAWVLPIMDQGDIARTAELGPGEHPTALVNFSPGAPIPALPGSEGLVGHLLRDVQGPGVLPPESPLPELARRRVRTILIVTDLSESGAQAVQFADCLTRNRTIRSWRSFGWIRIIVVSYAMSVDAERRLMDAPSIDDARFVRRAPAIRNLPWPTSEIEASLDLCRRYARGNARLGFADHGGLFGFQDRVPNTVPRMFRQRWQNWTPLFDDRRVPPALASELGFAVAPTPGNSDLLRTLRQERIRSAIGRQQHPGNRVVIAALAGLLTPSQRIDALDGSGNLSQDERRDLLRYLETQGWVGPDGAVTLQGRVELQEAKRKQRRVDTNVPPPDPKDYYPVSLR